MRYNLMKPSLSHHQNVALLTVAFISTTAFANAPSCYDFEDPIIKKAELAATINTGIVSSQKSCLKNPSPSKKYRQIAY